MIYKAAVWDLDGTLLNTLDDLTDATNYALRTQGLPARTKEEVCRFVGNGIRLLIERAVPAGTELSVTDRVYREFCTFYQAHCNDKTKPYEGIPDLLKTLSDAGVRMGIVSNKADFAVRQLARIYFSDVISVAVGARDGFRKKPVPDVVLEALAELGADAGEAVYIGDSEVDVKTAENAGMDCISVDWGFRSADILRQAGAKRILHTAGEVRAAILG